MVDRVSPESGVLELSPVPGAEVEELSSAVDEFSPESGVLELAGSGVEDSPPASGVDDSLPTSGVDDSPPASGVEDSPSVPGVEDSSPGSVELSPAGGFGSGFI